MHLVLGVDPSKSRTGLAWVNPIDRVIVATKTIRGEKLTLMDVVGEIEAAIITESPPDLVAIEIPFMDPKRFRLSTFRGQFELIGCIRRLCWGSVPLIEVSPFTAKKAVGVKRDPHRTYGGNKEYVIQAVERFYRVTLEGTKQDREAIADAIAIATAGRSLIP